MSNGKGQSSSATKYTYKFLKHEIDSGECKDGTFEQSTGCDGEKYKVGNKVTCYVTEKCKHVSFDSTETFMVAAWVVLAITSCCFLCLFIEMCYPEPSTQTLPTSSQSASTVSGSSSRVPPNPLLRRETELTCSQANASSQVQVVTAVKVDVSHVADHHLIVVDAMVQPTI
jgi:hypothetical protein